MRVGTKVYHPNRPEKTGKVIGTYPTSWEVQWDDGTKSYEKELKYQEKPLPQRINKFIKKQETFGPKKINPKTGKPYKTKKKNSKLLGIELTGYNQKEFERKLNKK